jgi:signal transduction histidine kinase
MGLLTNALEATAPGGVVTVRTHLSVHPGERRAVCISIEDNGAGIPRENRARVFEPFFTTKPHGTGIGLPLTKKFVEINGGKITVHNGSRLGTTVEVSLPVAT